MPTVRRFHQVPCKAREWSRSRKLVARVEATTLGTDVRVIVTTVIVHAVVIALKHDARTAAATIDGD